MPKRAIHSVVMSSIATIALILLATGCSQSDPTRPGDPGVTDLTLSGARISIGGQSLDGLDIHQGQYPGSMRYEACLTDPRGQPIVGGRVQVRYGMSGMMGGYMHQGEFFCYDDGTHGDPVPGDGIFCFVDEAEEYGCHRADAHPGEYLYEFCGFDGHGHESNRMAVTINLVP